MQRSFTQKNYRSVMGTVLRYAKLTLLRKSGNICVKFFRSSAVQQSRSIKIQAGAQNSSPSFRFSMLSHSFMLEASNF